MSLAMSHPFLTVFRKHGIDVQSFPLGCVIGKVELRAYHSTNEPIPGFAEHAGLHELEFGDYGPDRFAWELHNPMRLVTPIPAKGALGLWPFTFPDDATFVRPDGVRLRTKEFFVGLTDTEKMLDTTTTCRECGRKGPGLEFTWNFPSRGGPICRAPFGCQGAPVNVAEEAKDVSAEERVNRWIAGTPPDAPIPDDDRYSRPPMFQDGPHDGPFAEDEDDDGT